MYIYYYTIMRIFMYKISLEKNIQFKCNFNNSVCTRHKNI